DTRPSALLRDAASFHRSRLARGPLLHVAGERGGDRARSRESPQASQGLAGGLAQYSRAAVGRRPSGAIRSRLSRPELRSRARSASPSARPLDYTRGKVVLAKARRTEAGDEERPEIVFAKQQGSPNFDRRDFS